MCLELCIYATCMSYHVLPCHTMCYHVMPCVTACHARVHVQQQSPPVSLPSCLFVCLQDLKKKEGGGNGKAEELIDGTATKAGKHKLVNQMLSFCTYRMVTLGQDMS